MRLIEEELDLEFVGDLIDQMCEQFKTNHIGHEVAIAAMAIIIGRSLGAAENHNYGEEANDMFNMVIRLIKTSRSDMRNSNAKSPPFSLSAKPD